MRRLLGRIRSRRLALSLLILAVLAAAAGGAVVRWERAKDDLLRRGEQALAVRDHAAARDHLTRYLAARPGDAHARLLAARAARKLRQFDDASADLRRCRDDGGEAEAIQLEYALIAIERDGAEPGPGLRERARAGDELGLVVLETLIQYDLDAYRLYQALDGLTFYLDRRPGDLAALLSRGFVWERLLAFADAVEDYRRAVAAHPESEVARLKLGESLLIAGTPAEALEQFLWLHERRPDHGPVRLGLARCRRRLGQADDARRLLDGLLAEHPGRGELLWERGQLDLEDGDAAGAEAWLREAARVDPYDRRIAFSFAHCLALLGRQAEAEAAHARAEQIDRDLRRLDVVRTEVLMRPDDAAAWCEGGLLFLRNGEREEGLRWLRRALHLDPGCDAARAAIVAAEAGTGR
jgi:tetratricopeptide (TPR) repeat protein